MSSSTIKWTLFALFVFTLPLPFFALENGSVPAARLLFIGSLVMGILVQDPDMISGLLVAFYLGQGLLWSLVLYFVARFAAKRLAENASGKIVLAVVAVLLIGSSFFPIYRTPLSSSGLHSNILGIFD